MITNIEQSKPKPDRLSVAIDLFIDFLCEIDLSNVDENDTKDKPCPNDSVFVLPKETNTSLKQCG